MCCHSLMASFRPVKAVPHLPMVQLGHRGLPPVTAWYGVQSSLVTRVQPAPSGQRPQAPSSRSGRSPRFNQLGGTGGSRIPGFSNMRTTPVPSAHHSCSRSTSLRSHSQLGHSEHRSCDCRRHWSYFRDSPPRHERSSSHRDQSRHGAREQHQPPPSDRMRFPWPEGQKRIPFALAAGMSSVRRVHHGQRALRLPPDSIPDGEQCTFGLSLCVGRIGTWLEPFFHVWLTPYRLPTRCRSTMQKQ